MITMISIACQKIMFFDKNKIAICNWYLGKMQIIHGTQILLTSRAPSYVKTQCKEGIRVVNNTWIPDYNFDFQIPPNSDGKLMIKQNKTPG